MFACLKGFGMRVYTIPKLVTFHVVCLPESICLGFEIPIVSKVSKGSPEVPRKTITATSRLARVFGFACRKQLVRFVWQRVLT